MADLFEADRGAAVMTLDRATVEQALASDFMPDVDLVDAVFEDWLRKDEALAFAQEFIGAMGFAYRYEEACAALASRPQAEEEKP